MRHIRLVLSTVLCGLIATTAMGQIFATPPRVGPGPVLIKLSPPPAGFNISQIAILSSCAVNAPGPVALAAPPAGYVQGVPVAIPLALAAPIPPAPPQTLCIEETYVDPNAAHVPLNTTPPTFSPLTTVLSSTAKAYDDVCQYSYNDCDFHVITVAGIEQSDLSSQSSQTNAFVELIANVPTNMRFGTIGVQARFLGAPTTSNTQNVVAAATDPSGTVTSTSLATVGTAIDYMVTYNRQFFLPSRMRPGSGQFTVGPIFGFGATTPLDSQSATIGFAVPAYGTNECTQLISRFSGYTPPLPGSATITTTTTVGTSAPTITTSPACIVQQGPITNTSTSAAGVTTTTTTSGTQITNIAFSPVDRSDFLVKYVGGIRLIFRNHTGSSNRCSQSASGDHPYDTMTNGPCVRDMVDLTFGQDQSITGGRFHGAVFKSDIILPIFQTGVYFFGTASIRVRPNQNQPPLILAATPVSSGTAGTAGTVTIPSPSVFVLPLKQSDRDFYRIGIAIDLSKVFPKLFTPSS